MLTSIGSADSPSKGRRIYLIQVIYMHTAAAGHVPAPSKESIHAGSCINNRSTGQFLAIS